MKRYPNMPKTFMLTTFSKTIYIKLCVKSFVFTVALSKYNNCNNNIYFLCFLFLAFTYFLYTFTCIIAENSES